MSHEELVAELFPELAHPVVVEIDAGWDSLVLDVDDTWIVRVPRRAQVEEWLATEIALLPELAGILSVQVPRFERVVQNGVRCVAYRKLHGTPLAEHLDGPHAADLAAQVGGFLGELHSFPVARARELGVSGDARAWREQHGRFCDELRERIFPLLEPRERLVADSMFQAFVGDDENFAFDLAVVHADLGPEHVLCADGRVTGVIDWGDVRIGDAAIDFAWLLHAKPARFGEQVLERYGPVEPAFRDRARFYHRLGPWYEAHYGDLTGRPDFVRSGLAGIRSRLPRPLAFER